MDDTGAMTPLRGVEDSFACGKKVWLEIPQQITSCFPICLLSKKGFRSEDGEPLEEYGKHIGLEIPALKIVERFPKLLTFTVFCTQGEADTGAMTPLRGVPGGASETKVRCLRYAVWQDLAGRAWETNAWTRRVRCLRYAVLHALAGRAWEINAWTRRVRCLRYAVLRALAGRAWETKA